MSASKGLPYVALVTKRPLRQQTFPGRSAVGSLVRTMIRKVPLMRVVAEPVIRKWRNRRNDLSPCSLDYPSILEHLQRSTEDSLRYYEILEQAPLSLGTALHFIKENSLPSAYLDFHENRFAEQLSMFSWLCERFPDSLHVLDISTMPYTTSIMKIYRPSIKLVTIDYPETLGGPPVSRFEELGVELHVETDLNNANLKELATQVTKHGKFDLIYACEVVEHVRFDFQDFLKFCLDCLLPGGLVIVTTPNFHSEWKLNQIQQGLNPQHRFDGNNAQDGSYHFREYTMRELRVAAEALGAVVVGEIFSWSLLDDSTKRRAETKRHLRENMVFLCSNQGFAL